MDPLNSIENDDSGNNADKTFIISKSGEVHILLGGSHTTATETEGSFTGAIRKNVKFQKAAEEQEAKKLDADNSPNYELPEKEKFQEQQEEFSDKEESSSQTVRVYLKQKNFKKAQLQQFEEGLAKFRARNPNENITSDEELEHVSIDQLQLQNTPWERNEFSQRLEQIIDLFDSFTKNLETFEIKATSKAPRQNALNSGHEKRSHIMRIKQPRAELEGVQKETSFSDDPRKIDIGDAQYPIKPTDVSALVENSTCAVQIEQEDDFLKQQEMVLKDLENQTNEGKTKYGHSVSTATSSSELRSHGCQTQLSDHISLNDISLLDISSLTSRSELPNSLNNFAQAENACVSYRGSQMETIKQPLIQPPSTAPTVPAPETPTAPTFSVITVEANARPSSADLRRPSFCYRLWQIIADFCAATFLCLQVNRDCIFCLGFITAFVVSASFLTAFFYHTIIISPSMWQ